MQLNLSRLKLGAFVAVAIMGLTAAIPPISLTWLNEARTNRQQVEDRLLKLRRVLELLVDAETGQRGYVITGKDDFLQPYHAALANMPAALQSLQHHYVDDSSQERAMVTALLHSADLRVKGLAQVVQLRQRGGFAAAEPIVSSGQGKHDMDEVRRIAAELVAIETQELSARDDELRSNNWFAIGFSLAGTVLTLGLLASLAAMMSRAVRAGARSAREAHRTSEQLEIGMLTLRRRNEEMSVLGEMSRVLQTEMTLVEALEVTGLFCGRLLPGTSGMIYLYRNSADLLEQASSWGSAAVQATTMEPTACWGLRRGQMHCCDNASDLRCQHTGPVATAPGQYDVCLPLVAYGEVLGLLTVRGGASASDPSDDPSGAMADAAKMAQTISEQVALTLSNAKLRQVLRDQSIKDPLTGLYNRRYMEETLARELARSQRSGTSLALVVADLDHFKKINDTHGHPAGDAVLRAAARHLLTMIRASDVACRYGGEEFVLILVDCSKEAAVLTAQRICDTLRALPVVEGGRTLSVTASFGVSATADDGAQAGRLFEAADRAVYEAKRAGRDRVVAADATSPVLSTPPLELPRT